MFKQLLKLNFKIIFRSAIFYLSYALVFLLLVSEHVSLPGLPANKYVNYFAMIGDSVYVEIIIFILSFAAAVYFAHKKYTLEKVCFLSKTKIFMSKLISVAVAFSMLFLIPVVYMAVMSIIQRYSLKYFLLCSLYVVLKYISIVLPAVILGFIIGYIIRQFYAYIFSVPVAWIFSLLFKETIFKLFGYYTDLSYKIYHFITMNGLYDEGIEVEYRGPKLDILLLIKLSMVLAVCAAIILIFRQVLDGRFRLVRLGGMALCIAAYVGLGIMFFEYYPVRYDDLQKLYILDYEKQPYEITSYSGDISLKEWSDYDIRVGIRKTGDADSLDLRLDESMKIKLLDIDGKAVEYKRSGDILTLSCPDGEFTLNISCRGRISYVNNLNSNNIYTSNTSCALPPDFAFLPKIDGDKSKKQYDLSVKSRNALVSNLDFKKEKDAYRLTGSSQNACFFSGFLTQTEKDGVTFYHASCSQKLKKSFEAYATRISSEKISCFNPETYDFETYDGGEKPKVFMIYYLYGNNNFFVFYDDYTMYNYGYPF